MHFRHHSESDSRAIQALAASAFRDSEGEAEGALIGKLSEDLLERTEASDRFVFVACNEDTLAGVIFFTRMPCEPPRVPEDTPRALVRRACG